MKNVIPWIAVLILSFAPIHPAEADGSPDWKVALESIEQAKLEGRLTVDEAARLRLQALRDPQQLPQAFRPSNAISLQAIDDPEAAHCGLPEVADAIHLLMIDQEQWSEETNAGVAGEVQAAFEDGDVDRGMRSTVAFDHLPGA